MKTRPKSLLILVATFILVPVLNIIGTSLVLHVAPYRYLLDYLTQSTFGEKIGTFLLPWLAAYSLYICKKWSYAFFAVLMGIVFAENVETFFNYSSTMVRMAVGVAVLANVSVLVYLVFSENHSLFFNRNLRWWETPARFRVNVNAQVLSAEVALQATIKDISLDGLFLETPKPIEIGVPIEIAFSIEKLDLAVKARALRRQEADSFAYGMMIDHTAETRNEMKRIISTLKDQGVPTTQASNPVQQNT